MYKLAPEGNGVITTTKRGVTFIPNDMQNMDWREYQNWLQKGGVPEPADPVPVPDAPEPTISELISAIERKDSGDSTEWDEIKKRKKVKK